MNARRAAALLAVLALVASGCGGGGDKPKEKAKPKPKPAPVLDQESVDAAIAVATDYAIATRGVTAANAVANAREQARLSTGALRADVLRQGVPSSAMVRALQDTLTGSSAELLDVDVDGKLERDRVRLDMTLRERQWSEGAIDETITDNDVTVVRVGDAWRVAKFTIDPSAE